MLGQIDFGKQPNKPQLFLAKPIGDVIGDLSRAFDINYDEYLGKLNELTFSMYYDVDINNELKRDSNIDKIRDRYLLKLQLGESYEWFIINEITENMDDTSDFKTIHAFSLGYELNDKLIRMYNVVSYTATEVLTDALNETIWGVGYVDSDFDLKRRGFDVSEKTVLDFVYEIAEKFNAIVEFDTINRKINLKKQENIGTNKGLTIAYGKYLRSLNKNVKSDEFVTRLKVFGRDDISIQRLNPSGSDFIESFETFLFPYQEDVNGNVIQSSYYMSDGLCKAILNYQKFLDTKKGDFNTLLSTKDTYQIELNDLDTHLFNLKVDLKIILNNLDLAKSIGSDTTQLLIDKTNKESEITNKQVQIDAKKNEISVVDAQINSLRSLISVENNFTPEQIIEKNKFEITRVWSDENFTDDKELYDEAVKRFEEMKKPKTVFDIDIIYFLEIIEEQRNWDKLKLGDAITIYYEKFNIHAEAKIIEIHYDYENMDIKLTIANTKDIESEEDKLVKMLYNSHSTSTTVDMTNYKINETSTKLGQINEIINSEWDATAKRIVAGVNESVVIDGRGIHIRNPNQPNDVLVAQAGVLAVSNDNGNTWKHAITSEGIVGERIFGKIIAGVNLNIQNESGNYVFDGNGFTITSTDEKKRVLLDVDNGLKFQTKVGTEFVDKLYYDSNEDELILKGRLDATEITINNQSVLTGDKSKISGNFIDSITTNQLVAGTAKITSAMIDNITADQINGGTISGVTVNVDTNLTVGNNIYVGSMETDGQAKRLWFNEQANITGGTGVFGVSMEISCDELIIGGQVDFQNITPKNLNVTVSFG